MGFFIPLAIGVAARIAAGAAARAAAGGAARGAASTAARGAAKKTVKKAATKKATPAIKPKPPKSGKAPTKSQVTTPGERAQLKKLDELEKRNAARNPYITAGERTQLRNLRQLEQRNAARRDSARVTAAASGAGRGVKIQKKPSKGVAGAGKGGTGTQAAQMASAISGKRAGLGAVGATAGVMYAYGQMNKPKSGSNTVVPRSGEERRPRNALPPTVARPRPAAGPSSFVGSPSVAEGRKAGPSVGAQTKFGSGSGGGSGSTGRVAGSGGGGATKKPKKVPTVSQSRTMWVKKGTMVGGQEVKKGYLAQYGKAEKRVSAKVKIVTDTESGKKAGETWKYKTGQTVSQVKKKRK